VYSYEPFIDEMTEEQKKHIIGVQTNLWTEYIPTAEHLEYMLLPRMSAISEVQWCEPQTKSWERFRESADYLTEIYEQLGFNYAPHIFYTSGHVSLDKEKNVVLMHFETQGNAEIRYTVDGSEPTQESALYTEPVVITESCTVKGKAFRANIEDKTFSKEFHAHKAMGKSTVLETMPVVHYTYTAPDLLTDGIIGGFNFRSGDWAGWWNGTMEVVIDMKGEKYWMITLGALVIKYDDIFHPHKITVYTSEDGVNYVRQIGLSVPTESEDKPNGRKEYTLGFEETTARYLKVVASTVPSLPEWHPRAGGGSFLFVDEIVVR
jgi:hexosaminidase